MLPSFVRPTPMTDRLYEYVLSVGVREPEAFGALREETAKLAEAEWQIAPEQGLFLGMPVRTDGREEVPKSAPSPATPMWAREQFSADGARFAANSAAFMRASRRST